MTYVVIRNSMFGYLTLKHEVETFVTNDYDKALSELDALLKKGFEARIEER